MPVLFVVLFLNSSYVDHYEVLCVSKCWCNY